MKNNLNKIKLLFLSVTFFIASCSKDNYDELISKENNAMKVVVLDSKAIKKEKSLYSKVTKLNQNLSRLNVEERNITSSVYNFSIDIDYCKMITLDSITSYTFNVTREPNNGEFENLAIKRLPSGELITKLFKYNVTPEEKHNILHGIDVDMTNKIVVTDINDKEFTDNIFGKVYYSGSGCYQAEFVWSSATPCKGTEHHAYGDTTCPYYGNSDYMQAQPSTSSVVYVPVDCGGGGGSGTSTGTGYTGGTSTGGGIITSPIEPTISLEESMFKIFQKDLTDAQYDWLIAQDENVEASILNYLTVNDFDIVSCDFVSEYITQANLNPLSINDYVNVTPNFKMRKADQIKYPKFTLMVKNLKATVINNPVILNKLVQFSGLSQSQVLGKLTFGQGPQIELIPNLTGPSGPNFGNFDPNVPNVININENFALGIEVAYLESTVQATSFLMAITILHEFVHYGNHLTGFDTNGNEMGNLFEIGVYGVIITKDNAGQFYTQLK